VVSGMERSGFPETEGGKHVVPTRGETNMCIIRLVKNTNFVQIDNRSFENQGLSWKAKGILGYLLSRPDNWIIQLSQLIAQSTDGQAAVQTALKELEGEGYLKRQRIKNEKGQIQWEKIIYENPELNPEWNGQNKAPKMPENAPKLSKQSQPMSQGEKTSLRPQKEVAPQKVEKANVKQEKVTNGNSPEQRQSATEQQERPVQQTKEAPQEKPKAQPKFKLDFNEKDKEIMTRMLTGIDKGQQLIEVLEKMVSQGK
ncbi:Phage replication protein, partial [Candidatus Thiomargarita nelsonii]